jgi:hypothetical protein
MRFIVPTWAALAASLVLSAPAGAQSLTERAPPKHRVVHRSLIALRANPTGLIYDGRLAYRLRLYLDEGMALRDNYVGGGAALTVSPAFLRVGPYVEVAPASFVTLWSALQYSTYFGGFGLMQSFVSPRDDFSDNELERRDDLFDDDPLANYSASGLELTLGLDLQARVGPLAVRSQSRLLHANLDLREGDNVFYDQVTDMLMPDAGISLVSDFDAAYLGLDGRLVLGVRYTASLPFYSADSYQEGEPEENDNSSHRAGPVVAYTFFNRDGAAFNAPTVLAMAQWWIDHRYRTGVETSQGTPLALVGFRVHGDLIPLD